MRWSERLDKAQQYAALLVVFSFTLPFYWNTVFIWLLLATWLFSLKYKSTWRHYAAQPAYWVLAAFFFLNAASYFWSANKDQSVFDSVSKLVLVLFPVVLGAGANICAKRLEQILAAFVLTITATGVYAFIHATLRWQIDGLSSHFFYHDLVRGHAANAVYTAWYVFGALAAIFLGTWNHYFKGYWQALKWVCAALLMVFLALLSSRMLLVVFIVLVIPLYLYRLIIHSKRSWVKVVLIITTAGSIVAAFSLTGNPVEQRYRAVMNRNIHIAFLPEYRDTIPHFNNLTLRLFVWRCGMDNIKEHNLWLSGSGNGDLHTLQNERFAALGLTEDYQKKSYNNIQGMNLHNMYMEAFVTLGIPGLMLILAIVLLPFFFLKKTSQPFFFAAFHIVSLLFFVQESALQTQAGIIFWAFFTSIFWQDVKRQGIKELKEETQR